MPDPTDSELRKQREEQDAADRLSRATDAGAMGNIETAARYAGRDPADVVGTWQNTQREVAKFNQAQADERSRDPGAMGRTDAAELFERRQAAQRAAQQPQNQPEPTKPRPPAQNRSYAELRAAAGVVSALAGPAGITAGASVSLLSMPQKGFTKRERDWIEEMIKAINTARAVAGANVSTSESPGGGTIISARDCEICS